MAPRSAKHTGRRNAPGPISVLHSDGHQRDSEADAAPAVRLHSSSNVVLKRLFGCVKLTQAGSNQHAARTADRKASRRESFAVAITKKESYKKPVRLIASRMSKQEQLAKQERRLRCQ